MLREGSIRNSTTSALAAFDRAYPCNQSDSMQTHVDVEVEVDTVEM